jgi:aminomethyltransferase
VRTSPLLPLHQQAGARLTAPESGGEVITYGDAPGEYAAAAEGGSLLLDRTTRGLVPVTGADAADFLHRILANDVRGLAPGQGNRNMLLTGKGKVVHLFDLAALPEGFLVSTAPGEAPALVQALDMYLFTEDVQLGDETDLHAPLELVGPEAGRHLAAVVDGLDLEGAVEHGFQLGSFEGAATRVTRLPVAGRPGWRVETEPSQVGALWTALVAAGATPGGLVAFDSLRSDTLCAEVGRDVSEEVYPQEARLDGAFSLTKGCYIGQEVVAKIDTYGGLNKQLFRLRVSHDDPVAPGTRLVRELDGERRDLGVVTSWAYSFALDGGVVLAYVKRKHQEPGTEFELGETGATAALEG